MTQPNHDIQSAWGFAAVDERMVCARVTRESAGFVIHLSDDPASMNGHLPRARCLDDARLLYQRLDLPAADRDATQQMVAAQVEAFLPGRTSQFKWTWDRCEGTNKVWFAAARREAIEQPARDHNASIIATMTAVAAGLRVVLPDMLGRFVVLYPNGDSTAMLIMHDSDLISGCVLEPGLEAWRARPGACAIQAREALDAEGAADAPTRLLFLGEGIDPRPIAERLGLKVFLPEASPNLDAVAAIGAALTLMGEANPALDLTQRVHVPRNAAAPGKRTRRWLIAWIALAVAGLYLVDLYRAGRVENEAAALLVKNKTTGDASRRLVVARHLDSLGPTALVVFDEVCTAATDQVQLSDWRFGHREGIRFSASAQNADELNKFLEGLNKAASLEQVELVSQKIANNKCEFEISAKLRGVRSTGGRR